MAASKLKPHSKVVMYPNRPKYRSVRKRILDDLDQLLHKKLTYHGVHHTLEVMHVCNGYIRREKLSKYDALTLRTAALFHDYGFISVYMGHEAEGVEYAEEILPEYGYGKKQIKHIGRLIMATKIPQTPKCQLGEMICDADLDYFGRDDFKPIAESLFKEFNHFIKKINRVEWNTIQYNFLTSHTFFTPYAIKYRKPKKDLQLEKLRKWLERYG